MTPVDPLKNSPVAVEGRRGGKFGVSLTVFLAVSALLFAYARRELYKTATFSCVASIAAAINYQPQSTPSGLGAEWRTLADGELASLTRGKSGFDCAHSARPFSDSWAHSLHVAARRGEEGKLEFKVWSDGPDGASGTSDDIVVP